MVNITVGLLIMELFFLIHGLFNEIWVNCLFILDLLLLSDEDLINSLELLLLKMQLFQNSSEHCAFAFL